MTGKGLNPWIRIETKRPRSLGEMRTCGVTARNEDGKKPQDGHQSPDLAVWRSAFLPSREICKYRVIVRLTLSKSLLLFQSWNQKSTIRFTFLSNTGSLQGVVLGPRGKEAVNLVRQRRSLLLGRKIPPPFFTFRRKGRSLACADYHQVARSSVRGRSPSFVHFSKYVIYFLLHCESIDHMPMVGFLFYSIPSVTIRNLLDRRNNRWLATCIGCCSSEQVCCLICSRVHYCTRKVHCTRNIGDVFIIIVSLIHWQRIRYCATEQVCSTVHVCSTEH